MDPLERLTDLLADINTLSSAAALALPEVVDLLRAKLDGVELCSLMAIVEQPESADDHSSAPRAGVLIGVSGSGSEVLEALTVARGEQWSALQVARDNEVLHVRSAAAGKLDNGLPLPADFQRLHTSAQLCSFLSVPMALSGSVVGVLTVAASRPEAFVDPGWQRLLVAVAGTCTQYMRSPQLAYLASLLACAEREQDAKASMELLVYGLSMFMRRSTNLDISVRVGLVDKDRSSVLILERDPTVKSRVASGPAHIAFRPPPPEARAIVATEVPLQGSLMHAAITAHRARCIKDCAAYFQSAVKPAVDVFTQATSLVASLAVVPFSHDDTDLGGISSLGGCYFTLTTTSDFALLQEHILGAVSALTLTLHARLTRDVAALRASVGRAPDRSIGAGDGEGNAAASGSGTAGAQARSAQGSLQGSLQGVGEPFSAVSKRLCTEAIMRSVQHKLQTTHKGGRRTKEGAPQVGTDLDLVLQERIGQGGFGICYKGTYKGSLAAIKVMYARKHEREAMKDAVEMAIMSEVNHPNIVQLYGCLTNMIEYVDDLGSEAEPQTSTSRLLPRYRPTRAEDAGATTCSIVVMEFCDRGSLRDALRRGTFHKRSGESVTVDVLKVVRVLLQVSRSVEYLHDRKILHCDIKMENVLLKSDPTREMGFVAKLSDFGLAKMLNDAYFVTNRSGAGTITHLAPELLKAGAKLTEAIDSYAFGILMFTAYAAQRPYMGLNQEQIVERVLRKGLRPTFPDSAPPAFSSLAARCWDADAQARPRFAEISAALESIVAGGVGGLAADIG